MRKWILAVMLWTALPAFAQQGPGPATEDRRTERRQRNAAERQLRQQRFVAQLDSMVASGEFQFLPVSMQWGPRGGAEIITDFYYYVGIFKKYLQVHIPVVIGRAMTYNAIVNFDTDKMTDFRTQRNDSGWKVSFAATDDTGTAYTFVFTIYEQTGRAILDMLSNRNVMQYSGTIVANDKLPESPDLTPPMKRGPDGKLVPEDI